MFTGIVEELGEVVAVERLEAAARLRIRGPRVVSDARHGDSIAVNGVCLTVVAVESGEFTADVMAETLNRSALASLTPGSPVNLERALALGARLGGHIVQGHVDGTGALVERVPGEHWETVRFSVPGRLSRYIVEKGSITIDGVSLTVIEAPTADGAGGPVLGVGLIPTTLALTTLGHKRPGDPVNLEVDVLAKYVERLLAPGSPTAVAGHHPGAEAGR
ncbi:riboflavin synthase [Streptomyces sp. ST2-7A]|uniref:riboflavin synthase n=1 Tax=Streptomyces sp. ST2-7A TaxID=2907214 RepID=UPI001F2990A5|nr:riboflavin synthase [Streptomyces sp. ST2-7A]MCE7079670.1 riboflavin synthase [Streptomyces sp. ST2-7A]